MVHISQNKFVFQRWNIFRPDFLLSWWKNYEFISSKLRFGTILKDKYVKKEKKKKATLKTPSYFSFIFEWRSLWVFCPNLVVFDSWNFLEDF